MIKKITLNGIASFKEETSLETNKKINLIYGLNGTGKTTISKYLQSLSDPNKDNSETNNFEKCHIEDFDPKVQKILVYNQKFIQENFYESKTQKGVFTLQPDNKKALNEIDRAESEKQKLNEGLEQENTKNHEKNQEINKHKEKIKNKLWEINKKYVGGDRIFDKAKFLNGLKTKNNLYNYVLKINLKKTERTISHIEEELEPLLKGDNKRELLNPIDDKEKFSIIEKDDIFQKEIVGNENSTIAELITKLGNSAWVKKGLEYVKGERETCPFCQEETLRKDLIENIKNYFDESYKEDIVSLESLKRNYETLKKSLNQDDYIKDFFTEKEKLSIRNLFTNLSSIIDKNARNIDDKIGNPSTEVNLYSSTQAIKELKNFINERNKEIEKFNARIDNKTVEIEKLKNEFWEILRYGYNPYIELYKKKNKELEKEKKEIEKKIESLNNSIQEKDKIIEENQKKVTNIDEVIKAINGHLENFAIEDLKIEKHGENTYKIKRDGDEGEKIFMSLSEGEKTVISFLYFFELCKGMQDRGDTKKKIIVIDDPISSLSHIYVLNVAQLIKQEFTNVVEYGEKNYILKNDKYDQIFILTHNLYFFYELADTNHGRREAIQFFFRLRKNKKTSSINLMKYSEFQSDYEDYWDIIKNNENTALVANCMRNILEYFFGFIEREKPADILNQNQNSLKDNVFYRYINKSSHSFPLEKPFDKKTVNIGKLKECFESVFTKTGYENHYKKMMK